MLNFPLIEEQPDNMICFEKIQLECAVGKRHLVISN